MATTLTLTNSFGFTDPNDVSPSVTPDRGLQGDGIAYNGTDLFVVRTDAPTGPASRTQTILQFDTAGNYIGEFDLAAIGTVAVGATVLANGNLLVATLNPPGDGTFVTRLIEVAPDGSVPTGGIDLALPAEFNDRAQRGLVVGVAYDPVSTNILVVTSRSQEVVTFDQSGAEVAAISLAPYGVTAPQGLAVHPTTGNIWVADESEPAGGSNKIYEVTAAGELVSIIDTKAQFGWDDPESPDGTTLYVTFDGDDPGTVGNQVAVFELVDIPSAFTVTTTTDENDGSSIGTGLSLRDALLAATASAEAASTIFLPAGTYTLDQAGGNEDAGVTGDLDIFGGKTITIVGAGTNTTTIDAAGIDRVFNVLGGSNLIISGVTITGGLTPSVDPFTGDLGGGIYVQNGTLSANDIVVDDNRATNGGGIFLGSADFNTFTFFPGTATITNSTISNNSSTFDAGGISSLFGSSLTLTNSTVSGNTADRDAGGIGVAFSGSVTIEGSTITGNAAQGIVPVGTYGVGGGVHVNDGTATVSNSTIANNTALTAGGGIALGGSDPSGQGNPAPVTATITDVTLTGNTAGSSSGIALLSTTGTTPPEATVRNVGNFFVVTADVVTADVGQPNEQIAFDPLVTIPNLLSIDKYGDAAAAISFALTDFTEKLVDVAAFPGPAYSDADGDALASLTIVSLPTNGTLTLSGADVSVGTEIAAANIANLVYTSNAAFGGVDTFQVQASDGIYDSAPANVDVFVNAPEAIDVTLLRTFDFNSADGLTFNPTTGTIFASDSYRQVATDPNTVVWALREINATTGAEIRAVAESEDDLLGAGVPNVDIDPNTVDEGIQGMAVVQGTGTSRDGNVLLLSTRAAKVIEIDYQTGEQVTAAEGGFEFTNPFIFSNDPPSSVTGIYHTIVNGEEVLWAVDFRGVGIVQFAKDGTLNQAATIDLSSEIPEAELQGIAIDPATGNFLLADDATGNTSNIYEVTPDGELIGITNLLELGGSDRFADTEGLGINPLTRELYVAIDDDLRQPNFNIGEIGDQIAVLQLSTPEASFNPTEPGDNGFLQTQTAITLQINIRSNTTISVASELVVFAVDDAEGKVGDNAPGSTGYLNAILDNNKLLGTMSFLAGLDNPSGLGDFADIIDDFSQLIELAARQRIGFLLVEGGSLGDEGASIFYSNQSNFSVEAFSSESFSLSFAGTDVSFDLDLKAEPPGLGKKRFGLQTGREYLECLDRRGQDDVLRGNSVRVYSEAAFDNLVGFYLTDINGNVLNITTRNVEARVGDGNGNDYLAAVVANRLDISLSANITTTIDFVGGEIITPFLVSNGTFENFTNVFTPFYSTDNFDHFRLLGSGTFAVEDQLNGGDQDFDDMIIQVTFS